MVRGDGDAHGRRGGQRRRNNRRRDVIATDAAAGAAEQQILLLELRVHGRRRGHGVERDGVGAEDGRERRVGRRAVIGGRRVAYLDHCLLLAVSLRRGEENGRLVAARHEPRDKDGDESENGAEQKRRTWNQMLQAKHETK